MTATTMRETPSFDQGDKVCPKKYADLGEKGDFRFLVNLQNLLPKDKKIEEADALYVTAPHINLADNR